jgi:hypothetical protein
MRLVIGISIKQEELFFRQSEQTKSQRVAWQYKPKLNT